MSRFYEYEQYGQSALKLMFDAHADFFFDPESFDDRYGEVGRVRRR
ncbi:hypothetical protein GQS65_17255, partial [Halomarina oriensis]|nr:hypothetical protein [Halomarina oriensis]